MSFDSIKEWTFAKVQRVPIKRTDGVYINKLGGLETAFRVEMARVCIQRS